MTMAQALPRQTIVAVLFQALPPPANLAGGSVKPAKPGGYRDSGADIGFALRCNGVEVVTPEALPDPGTDADWVWPDTAEGISAAVAAGATVLWANTSLFAAHPLVAARAALGVRVVGADPANVEAWEDKFEANRRLEQAVGGFAPAVRVAASRPRLLLCATESGAASVHSGVGGDGSRNRESGGDDLLSLDECTDSRLRLAGFEFPLVVKPVRGRGSEGVTVAADAAAVRAAAGALLGAVVVDAAGACAPRYGSSVIVEQFLDGQELTVTVMPPGHFAVREDQPVVERPRHWALTPVRRFNHVDGVAPYNGVVAVSTNSAALTADEVAADPAVREALLRCEGVGTAVGSAMPIRIDCRMWRGSYRLFDVNIKPNMTGPGRPGRDDQASLTLLAAQAAGWSYPQLLKALLVTAW
jgi:D-alanine-D-alanine ligase